MKKSIKCLNAVFILLPELHDGQNHILIHHGPKKILYLEIFYPIPKVGKILENCFKKLNPTLYTNADPFRRPATIISVSLRTSNTVTPAFTGIIFTLGILE